MAQLKIGISLASLRLPLRKALVAAARLGAKGVEIDARNDIQPHDMSQTGLREFRKLLTDLDLRVSAVAFPTRRGYHDLEDLDRRVSATKAALKFARELGTDTVVNQVGPIPGDTESREWQTLLEALTDLGNYGQHAGAILAAKTGQDSGPDLARLLAALPDGALGIDLDPGNLVASGHSALEAVQTLGPHIHHVHATDAVRDPGRSRGLEVQLGRGTADFPQLAGALEEFAYRGWFTIDRRTTDEPQTELADAVEFLKSL